MPRGRKPAPKPEPAPDVQDAEVLAKLLTSAPPERVEQLRDALWDRACGYRWWAGSGRKPGGLPFGAKTRRVEMKDLATGELVEGWIYEVPGDPVAQRLVLEHGLGRPAVRELPKQDTVVTLVHRVPGRRLLHKVGDRETTQAERETPWTVEEEPALEDPLAAAGLGLGALMPAEPEDDPGGDE